MPPRTDTIEDGDPAGLTTETPVSRKRKHSPSQQESPSQNESGRKPPEFHSPHKKMVVMECLKHLNHLLLDKEIFESFGIPYRTGLRWKTQARIEEVHGPRVLKKRGRKQAIDQDTVEKMKEALVTNPEISSWDALGKQIGCETSWRTVQRSLERDGFCSQLACTKNRLITGQMCAHVPRPPIDRPMIDALVSNLANSGPDQITSWKALGKMVGCQWGWKAVQRAMVKEGYCKQIACAKRWLSHGELCNHVIERAAAGEMGEAQLPQSDDDDAMRLEDETLPIAPELTEHVT